MTGLAATGNPLVWTATYTPTPGFDGEGSVSVAPESFADAAGNQNAEGASDTVDVDALDPTITVAIAASALNEDGTSLVTFTFSEAPTDFAADDIEAVGGTVTGLAATGNPLVWTATYTPTPGFDGEGSVSVAPESFADAAGNQNAEGASDTVDVDALDPTITVAIAASALNEDGTSLVTFTFSEAPTDFAADDIEAVGGTVTGLAATGNPLVWTATYTPTPGFDGEGSVSVAPESFADAAGNQNAEGASDTVDVDALDPTITVAIAASALNEDGTSLVTFTFSEAPTDFAADDIEAVGGTVTGLAATGNPLVWTATYTPTPGFDGEGSVSVAPESFADAAGNQNAEGASDTVDVDALDPTITVAIAASALNEDGTSLVTFTFSEAPTDFAADDIEAVGGTVTGLAATGNPLVWTATYTPTPGFDGEGSVSVAPESFADAAGNQNAEGASDTVDVDALDPTITVAIAASALNEDGTSLVTFTFSEAPTDFAADDIEAVGGTVTGLAATGNPLVWTATYTPTPGFDGEGSVSVAPESFADAAGNQNAEGASDTVDVDALDPTITVAIAASALNEDGTSLVTFTFSEAPTDFAADDIEAVGGTVTGLAATGNPLVWTATYTPTPGFDGEGSVSVAPESFADAAGNQNAEGASDTVDVDALDPTITVAIAASALNEDGTSLVTFTFSEAPTDFAADDIEAVGGTVTGLAATGNPLVWTATYTPTPGFDGEGSVSVAPESFADAAGNQNAEGASDTVDVDALDPTITVAIAASALNEDGTSLVTFTFSEAPTDFAADDIEAVGGTVTGLAATGNPLVWTATYTPTPGFDGEGSVSVAPESFADAAGNQNAEGASDTVDVDALDPTMRSILSMLRSTTATQSRLSRSRSVKRLRRLVMARSRWRTSRRLVAR